MGCDELIAAIGESAARQREEILAQAETQAQALISEAEGQRDALIEKARARGAAAGRAEGSRIESRARIGAKREILKARYEVIEATLSALERRLRDLAGTAEYRPVLESLLAECLEESSGSVVVRCRPEDRELVEDYGGRNGLAIAVEEAPFPLGGVETAAGPDGSCVCRNTFVDRMEKIRPLLLQEAGRLLFGAGGVEAGT